MTPLIDIAGLKVVFHGDRGRTMHAVDTINFELARGATLGIVGEFGLRQKRHRAGHHGTAAESLRRSVRSCPV